MMNNELIPTPMMSFGESVKTCFQKYVTFKGRARRSEYWWFWLLNLTQLAAFSSHGIPNS